MTIWQLILVTMPIIRFGASLYEVYKSDDKTEKQIGRLLGSVIFLFGTLYVLYRANVLIIV